MMWSWSPASCRRRQPKAAPARRQSIPAARRRLAWICLASLLSGGSGITAKQAVAALLGAGDEAARNVMMEVRLPRLLAAFGVGGLLALAGVLLQALFRNPLADPYVLGVSGGAAVGALLAMITGAAAVM